MVVIAIIIAVVALIIAINAQGRVGKLERLKSGAAPQSAPSAVPQVSAAPQASVAPQATVAPPVSVGPSAMDRFGAWLKEDWLMKLGAVLLIIGFGWLTTYAFLNGWIGPQGRIGLGITAGALFIVIGWWRIRSYIHQGGVFLVLGSTTILVTIYAARNVYEFFTPLTALGMMFLSTVFVAVASVKYNNRALSLVSLILAGVAPLLTNSPTTDYIALFAYLLVVILGAIWIVALTGQRELTLAALLVVTFYSLPHLLSFGYSNADGETLLLFAYAFGAIFFLTNTIGIVKLKDKSLVPDLITAAGTGLFLLAWILNFAPDQWMSLIIAVWMVIFSVGAFLTFKMTQRREPFYIYAGVSVGLLAAATNKELNGAALTIAYTIESGIVALISYILTGDNKVAKNASLLLIGPAILSLGSIASRNWVNSVFHEDFFVLLILCLTLFGLGLFLRGSVLLIAGSVYAYILLWLSLHAGIMSDFLATMIALAIYTLIGLVCYFRGLSQGKKTLRLYGGILVGFVVGRLLAVDIWHMEITGRIITFFLIGAILVSTAFLGRNKKS